MAEEPIYRAEAEDDEWREVTAEYRTGNSNKHAAQVRLSRGGAVEGNVGATELLEQIAADRGLPPREWALSFQARLRMGQVACTPIPLPEAGKGTGGVRWHKGKGSDRAGWHIGGVFAQFPELRPSSEQCCLVTRGTGRDGGPTLIILLGAGFPVRRGSRGAGAEG